MSWKDYKGPDGYHKMLSELQASFDKAYPEFLEIDSNGNTLHRVYAFNQLLPIDQAIAEAEAALGVAPGGLVKEIQEVNPSKDFPNKKIYGQAFVLKREDGTEVVLTMGWGKPEKLTAEHIMRYAWNNLHELGHGVVAINHSDEFFPNTEGVKQIANDKADITKGRKSVRLDWLFEQLLERLPQEQLHASIEFERKARHNETHAELFSRVVMVRNGAPENIYIDWSTANYDSMQIEGYTRYDPGEEMTYIKDNYAHFLQGGDDKLLSYNLEGFREANEIAFEALEAHKATSGQDYYEEMIQAIVAGNINRIFIGAGGVLNMSEAERKDWLSERSHIIRDASQAVAGMEFKEKFDSVNSQHQGYISPKPGVLSLEQAAGRALLKYQETGSSVDQNLAASLLKATFKLDDHGYKADFNLNNSDAFDITEIEGIDLSWAQQLADGVAIEEVVEDIQIALTQARKNEHDVER